MEEVIRGETVESSENQRLLICSNQLLSLLFILTMKSVKPDNLIFDQSTRWLLVDWGHLPGRVTGFKS